MALSILHRKELWRLIPMDQNELSASAVALSEEFKVVLWQATRPS